jgi:hypothetical protein
MNQKEIIVRAVLHQHNWAPGTDYEQLTQEILPMFHTVRELDHTIGYTEFKQLLQEVA